MPIVDGIGYSEATKEKQSKLESFMKLHMRVVNSIWKKYNMKEPRYIYIDTTAGSGANESLDLEGSPMIFLKIAEEMDIPFKAYFIEEVAANFELLFDRINNHYSSYLFNDNYENINLLCGDNKNILCDILHGLNGKEYGIIYMDPNGIPDFDLLSEASRIHKKLDIIVRCPANAIKRNNHKPSLIESINKIEKNEMLISEPCGKFQWTFLIFANYAPEWRKRGFHSIFGEIGKSILFQLNFTKEQLHNLKEPEYEINQKVKERSGGNCEMCKLNKATEIHHVKGGYSTLDANKRIFVCHQCHCELEGMNE